MERTPNTPAASQAAAESLLRKLQDDLVRNASDKQAVEEEAALAAKQPVKRYRFRVMKHAEYEEKKRIAEKLAAAADNSDLSDEELQTLLRTYLKDSKGFSGEAEQTETAAETVSAAESSSATETEEPEAAEEPEALTEPETAEETEVPEEPELTESAEPEAAVSEDGTSSIGDMLFSADELDTLLDGIDADGEIDAEGETAEAIHVPEEPSEAPEAETPLSSGDLSQRLSAEEQPFVEELPMQVEDSAAESYSGLSDEELSAQLDAAFQEALASEDDEDDDEEYEDVFDEDEADEDEEDSSDALFAEVDLLGKLIDEAASGKPGSEKGAGDERKTDAHDRMAENGLSDDELAALLDSFEEKDTDAESTGADVEGSDVEDFGIEDMDIESIGDTETDAGIVDEAETAVSRTEEGNPDAGIAGEDAVLSDETEAPSEGGKPNEDDDIDPTDVDLMIAFGMEDQIDKNVGEEEAGKLKKAIGARKEDHLSEMHKSDRVDTALDPHVEYVSSAQNKEIFSEYKKHYSSILFRFFGAAVLLILLFFFENNNLLRIKLPGMFDRESYPLVYTLFDLQLVALLGAMVWKGVRAGFRAMFRGKPIPESITALSLLACLVYTTVIAALCPMHGLQLYNFPIALTVFFELCYEFMNLRREIMSFKIISSKKLKYAVDPVAPQDSETERRMFAKYLSDDPSMFRIKRSAFIEDFFKRTETYPRTQRILRAIFPAVLLLTIACFCAVLILSGSVYTALNTAYIMLLLTLPSGAFISFSYPMYRASGFAYEKDSAMIGEASLGVYADASVISFDDKEVFPPQGIRVRNVKVYGNNRIDHVIYAAASVFHVVGGPLADVFETATGELGYASDVQLIRVDTDGIEARIGGDAVLCGKASFMNRYGYGVSLSESEKTMEQTGDASMLFVAYENNIAAKLYLQYSVEPDFEIVLKQLYRQNVCVGIKTSDPNIDDHLLSCKIKMSKYPIRIIKCSEPKETAIVVDTLSSGIVSKSSAKALLQTLAMCERVLSASRTNNVIKIVSMLLGMAAMAFFVLSGMAVTTAPLWIALYQLFWIIPMVLISRYYI